MIEMRAKVPFDRDRKHIRRGELFIVENDNRARDYERRGIAERTDEKVAPAPNNKMAQEPDNKAPSSAGGEAQPSSASPPARRSRRTTAKPSGAGAKKTKAKRAES
jgi:hypothetical protein